MAPPITNAPPTYDGGDACADRGHHGVGGLLVADAVRTIGWDKLWTSVDASRQRLLPRRTTFYLWTMNQFVARRTVAVSLLI